MFRKRKKVLLIIFTAEAIIYEVFFLIMYFMDPSQIGTQMSAFVVEWAIWIQIYLLMSIVLLLLTGFIFSRKSLKSDNKDLKLKGWFLIIAFILFTIGTVIDVVAADAPTEITIFLARTFVILSSICFYVGFTLPKFIKELFLKSDL